MRLFWVLAITAMASFSLNAADLGGTWKGSMDTQMGDTEVTITVTPGATLAGNVQVGEFQAAMEQGKLDGDKIYFQISIQPGRLTFEGTVAGDEMKLTVTGTQGNNYSLLCKRQKTQ